MSEKYNQPIVNDAITNNIACTYLQVEATRLSTATLTTDLDAMRHLFSEKEKELVLAVSKVEELTRQLEELRQGRSPLNPNNQHHNELDKLRRELLVSWIKDVHVLYI